ncbi:MAG TPA: GGDEF domain-containing protein [bacterium]|jgi:diguanylate cyclase (GGDEF)-like protein|nr:GGDEF domain-containing protein [bacterium]
MLKQRILLVSLCAAACAAPLLALLWPSQRDFFAANPASLDYWQRGLSVGLAVLALLAWRLNQNRLAVIAAGLAVAAVCAVRAAASGRPPLDIANAWLVAVPGGLALSLLPGEGALFSGRSIGRAALLFLPAGLAWAVANSNPADTAQLLGWRLWGGPGQPSHLAHLGLLFFALAAWRFHARIESALLALGGSLIGLCGLAWGLSLAGSGTGPLLCARMWLAGCLAQAAGLALGLFLLYWQRVYLDELTGVPNRRALDERLGHLSARSVYSLAMVDIDHFKKFNDTYGHAQGDDVLRLVARHLKESTQGRAYRYGGEEFCVLAPELDTDDMESLMDAAREGLAASRFHVRQPPPLRRKSGPKDRGKKGGAGKGAEVQVTVSVGVARCDRKHDSPAKVLKLADEGLYEAKAAGRNIVVRKN